MNLTHLFCDIDDFCQDFIPEWRKHLISDENTKRNRAHRMSYSEIITIWIFYHQSGYRTFKWFYQKHIQAQCRDKFPNLLSYSKLIEIVPKILVPITVFMRTRQSTTRGIAFVDSTPLSVCKNLRIPRHKTFKGEARRGKSSTGWFYGFKLHLIVNEQGEILSFCITPGNVDDRRPVPK